MVHILGFPACLNSDATFHVFNSHMWLVATKLDSEALVERVGRLKT